MEHERIDEARWEHLLEPLREICLSLPETQETINFGAPWFRAGKKVFAMIARDSDDGLALWFRADPLARETLLEDGRFTPAPYMHRHGWLATPLDDAADWGELEELLLDSYRLQALKRMLRALDG